MGAWGKFTMPGQPPELGHLNGNMLVRPDLPEVVPSCIGSPPRIPWDVYHAKRFERAGWAPTPLIFNAYQKPEISESEWDEYASAGAVFLHGVKGKSALEISARRLLVTA
jgi:hypothetical protein